MKTEEKTEDTRPHLQRLCARTADVCANCGQKVFFRFVSSYTQADGRFRVVYLRCPHCAARASRLVEIVSSDGP